MRQIIMGIVLIAVSSTATAMSWQELEGEIRRVEAGATPQQGVIQRLSEIVETVAIYTRVHKRSDSASLLFCGPEDTTVSLDELTSLIREQARLSEAAGSEPVAQLLLQGLMRRYPCH